jgi:hypothetical protein
MRLVRDKLIPLRLLIPAGPATHEWSREYRDLIFEMAFFVEGNGGEVTLNLVRKFVNRRPKNDILERFSEPEVSLLMKKSVEYDLPVYRRMPSTKPD